MKVLIVDDQPEKVARIKRAIETEVSADSIVCACCAQDGIEKLSSNPVCLVILDVVLPLAYGDTENASASLWFVREVARKLGPTQTPFILGVTQHAETLANAREAFRDYLWNVIHASETNARWVDQMLYAVRYAKSQRRSFRIGSTDPNAVCDAAIITALRNPEFSAISEILEGGDQVHLPETGENWLIKEIDTVDGRRLRVVAASAADMGMPAMASLTTKLVMLCRPRTLLLIGIMGGNAKRVGLSDLVIAEQTWDCRAGKLTNQGFSPDVKGRNCEYALANAVVSAATEKAILEFWSSWKGVRPRVVPRVHRGDVACSSFVAANDDFFEELERHKRKILGVEMEAYGCYDAAARLGVIAPQVVCMKSVCDFGNGEKNDQFQEYCASLAAHFAVLTLRTMPAVL